VSQAVALFGLTADHVAFGQVFDGNNGFTHTGGDEQVGGKN
jgi:hypothetical protein